MPKQEGMKLMLERFQELTEDEMTAWISGWMGGYGNGSGYGGDAARRFHGNANWYTSTCVFIVLLATLLTAGCSTGTHVRAETPAATAEPSEVLHVSSTNTDLGLELTMNGAVVEIRSYRLLPDGGGDHTMARYTLPAATLSYTGMSLPGVLRWLAFGDAFEGNSPQGRMDITALAPSLREWNAPGGQVVNGSVWILSLVMESRGPQRQSRIPWDIWIMGSHQSGNHMRVRDIPPFGISGEQPPGYRTRSSVVDSILPAGPNVLFLVDLFAQTPD